MGWTAPDGSSSRLGQPLPAGRTAARYGRPPRRGEAWARFSIEGGDTIRHRLPRWRETWVVPPATCCRHLAGRSGLAKRAEDRSGCLRGSGGPCRRDARQHASVGLRGEARVCASIEGGDTIWHRLPRWRETWVVPSATCCRHLAGRSGLAKRAEDRSGCLRGSGGPCRRDARQHVAAGLRGEARVCASIEGGDTIRHRLPRWRETWVGPSATCCRHLAGRSGLAKRAEDRSGCLRGSGGPCRRDARQHVTAGARSASSSRDST